MSKRFRIIAAVVIGLLFLGLGFLYALKTAGELPAFIPGYEAGSAHIHVKHSIAAFILGIGSFIYAWFQSGPKSR